jgi:hypothetical protein
MNPTRPSVARKATKFSPNRPMRSGRPSASSLAERHAGTQYSRSIAPIGVPGPIRVSSSLSAWFIIGAASRYEPPAALTGCRCAPVPARPRPCGAGRGGPEPAAAGICAAGLLVSSPSASPFLKLLTPLAEVAHHLADLAATEQHQDHQCDDDPVPET